MQPGVTITTKVTPNGSSKIISTKRLFLLCTLFATSVLAIYITYSRGMLELPFSPRGNSTTMYQAGSTPIHNKSYLVSANVTTSLDNNRTETSTFDLTTRGDEQTTEKSAVTSSAAITSSTVITTVVNIPSKQSSPPSSQTHQDEHQLPPGDHLYSLPEWHQSLVDIKHTGLPVSLRAFESVMDRSQSKQIRDVFFATVHVLQEHKVEYFLCGGTLLGSYRHHNMIPWDDDLDMLTNASNKDIIRTAFKGGSINVNGITIALVEFEKAMWKTYLERPRTKSERFSKIYWPFVDLFFFIDKGDHLYGMRERRLWPKTKLFPLAKRPFEGTLQPVPCDIEYALNKITFNDKVENICKSNVYNHIKESGPAINSVTISCSALYPYLPFVDRVVSGNNITEILKVNNTVLGHFKPGNHLCN